MSGFNSDEMTEMVHASTVDRVQIVEDGWAAMGSPDLATMTAQALAGGIPWVQSHCALCSRIDPDRTLTIRAGYAYSATGAELTNQATGFAAEAPRWIAGAIEAQHRQRAHPSEPLVGVSRDGSIFDYYAKSLERYEAASAVAKRGESGLVTVTTHPGIYRVNDSATREEGGNPEDEGPQSLTSTDWADFDRPQQETQKFATYWLSMEPLDRTYSAYARTRKLAYAERDRLASKTRTERPS
jgi:hypothetical protein